MLKQQHGLLLTIGILNQFFTNKHLKTIFLSVYFVRFLVKSRSVLILFLTFSLELKKAKSLIAYFFLAVQYIIDSWVKFKTDCLFFGIMIAKFRIIFSSFTLNISLNSRAKSGILLVKSYYISSSLEVQKKVFCHEMESSI